MARGPAGGRRARRGRGGLRAAAPWVLWGAVGAVRTISGADSVRRATYDEATRTAEVDVTSRYYASTKQ